MRTMEGKTRASIGSWGAALFTAAAAGACAANSGDEAANNSDDAIVGQAVPSYGPARAGAFFKKIECFCFTPQKLAAGERRQMPVLFVLDPSMDKDLHTVTLSYTFFNTDPKAQTAALPEKVPHG